MSQIEYAIDALRDAADALEAVPLVLRTTKHTGLWLGDPPPLVTPALLRQEADHIEEVLGKVRSADEDPPVAQDLTDAEIVTELHRCEVCADTRSPDDHRCPNEDCPSHWDEEEDEGGVVNLGGPIINVFVDAGVPRPGEVHDL